MRRQIVRLSGFLDDKQARCGAIEDIFLVGCDRPGNRRIGRQGAKPLICLSVGKMDFGDAIEVDRRFRTLDRIAAVDEVAPIAGDVGEQRQDQRRVPGFILSRTRTLTMAAVAVRALDRRGDPDRQLTDQRARA